MIKVSSEFELLRYLAYDIRKKIIQEIILELKNLKRRDGVMIYGDDSGLENAWEEFCVNVQLNDDFARDAFIETIYEFAKSSFEKTAFPYNLVLSYIGFSNNGEEINEEFGFSEDDAIKEIIDELEQEAMNDESRRVLRYLDDDFEEE